MKRKKWIPQEDWKIMQKYFPMLIVDGILIEKKSDKLSVCLVKRVKMPFAGYWVIPGGYVDKNEKLRNAAVREFWEETGLKSKVADFVGIYDNSKRDPRGHNVGVAYLLRRTGGKIRASDETSDVRFFPVNKLPKNIGFDHKKIINDALKVCKRRKKYAKKSKIEKRQQ